MTSQLRHGAPASAPSNIVKRLIPALKKWTVPVLGAVTPIGLMIINIAAYIFKHITEFRLGVTILAFISGMLLNSWTAWNVYGVFQRKFPNSMLSQSENYQGVLLAGVFVVMIASALTAFFCWQGLGDREQLPNGLTFFTGAIAIAIPIFLQILFGRGNGKPATGHGNVATTVYPPPSAGPPPWQPPPGAPAPVDRTPSGWPPGTGPNATSGKQPPFLPPTFPPS